MWKITNQEIYYIENRFICNLSLIPDNKGIFVWEINHFFHNDLFISGSTFDLSLGLHEMMSAINQYYH